MQNIDTINKVLKYMIFISGFAFIILSVFAIRNRMKSKIDDESLGEIDDKSMDDIKYPEIDDKNFIKQIEQIFIIKLKSNYNINMDDKSYNELNLDDVLDGRDQILEIIEFLNKIKYSNQEISRENLLHSVKDL